METAFVWLPRFDFAPHPSATDGESLPVRRFVNVCPCKPIRQRSNERPPTGSGALYPKTNRAKARTMMMSEDIDDGKVPESQGKPGGTDRARAKNHAVDFPQIGMISPVWRPSILTSPQQPSWTLDRPRSRRRRVRSAAPTPPPRLASRGGGGALGPRLFHVVRCTSCRAQYNGRKGTRLTTVIVVYQLVALTVVGLGFAAWLASRQ